MKFSRELEIGFLDGSIIGAGFNSQTRIKIAPRTGFELENLSLGVHIDLKIGVDVEIETWRVRGRGDIPSER